ncbi:MAG: hypothetical protein QOE11_1161 [Solirubrobacteraceae bacterium]|jgi:opacity protein-like surface antigen|nr:hypothetical protein [Solirubrobacteraceae bacterium]
MKRFLAAAASAALLLAIGSSSAMASPVPVFTALPSLNHTVSFDASASVCHIGFCGYNYKYYGPTTNRLGVQMGNVPKITYTFPALGFYTVVLTVSEKCSPAGYRWCPASISQVVTVL